MTVHSRRRGFALMAALWLMVAIGAASLAIGLAARTRRLAAANVSEGTTARWGALGAIHEAEARLTEQLVGASDEGATDPWADGVEGLADTMTVGGTQVRLATRDLGTTLDLNAASEDELRRLFVALTMDAGDADRLAQAIADWRDPDDLRRGRGAEREDYLAAGAWQLPANGPFGEVQELAAVRGMTSAWLDRLRPLLSVGGSGLVNINDAPAAVLLALPGVTPAVAQVILRHRSEGRPVRDVTTLGAELPPTDQGAFAAALPALMARVSYDAREIELDAVAAEPASPVRVRVRCVAVRAGTQVLLTSLREGW